MTLSEWVARVERRECRVGIVGMGYVGLPLALEFVQAGFGVVGFDIDEEKVRQLNAGESYIQRIGPPEIRSALARGFAATVDFAKILEVDAVLICVPTPLHDDHTPDMSFVVGTVEAIAPWLQPAQIVVLESTTYPGTTEEIVCGILQRAGRVVLRDNAGEGAELNGVMVAFSPEREDPGNVEVARRTIPKVIGGVDGRATEAARALYAAVFDRTVTMSSPAAAEMTKLLENIYRNVNIALVNEMKQLCGRMGIDIWEVIEAAKTKPFGFQAFYPGPGVGGHCIPVDPFYLSWKAAQMGFAARFIELAGEVNEAMPAVVVEAVRQSLRAAGCALAGASVLALGVAYKRDVDDLRESPALVVIEMLKRAGAKVEYNDPYFPVVGRGRRYDLQMRSTPVNEAARFDCVVILTDHSCYDWSAIVRDSRLVIDSRNATRGMDSARIVRC